MNRCKRTAKLRQLNLFLGKDKAPELVDRLSGTKLRKAIADVVGIVDDRRQPRGGKPTPKEHKRRWNHGRRSLYVRPGQ